MSSNNPSSLRPMIKTKPMTSAVPNAWTVSAIGHPHNSFRTQAENCELSSHSSTAQSPSLIVSVKRSPFSEIGQQPAENDHPGPCQQHHGGNPFGSCRRSLSCFDVPKPVGHREIQNRGCADGDESYLRCEPDVT